MFGQQANQVGRQFNGGAASLLSASGSYIRAQVNGGSGNGEIRFSGGGCLDQEDRWLPRRDVRGRRDEDSSPVGQGEPPRPPGEPGNAGPLASRKARVAARSRAPCGSDAQSPDDDRVELAVRIERIGKTAEAGIVELLTRLIGIRINLVRLQEQDFRSSLIPRAATSISEFLRKFAFADHHVLRSSRVWLVQAECSPFSNQPDVVCSQQRERVLGTP